MKKSLLLIVASAPILSVSPIGHTKAQSTDWEGVWAQTKAQCLCEFYFIDVCEEGGGLPPLQITRKTVTAPELSCRVTSVELASSTTFAMRANCTSEGSNGTARIEGSMRSGTLEVIIKPSKSLEWSQGDYQLFTVKCRR